MWKMRQGDGGPAHTEQRDGEGLPAEGVCGQDHQKVRQGAAGVQGKGLRAERSAGADALQALQEHWPVGVCGSEGGSGGAGSEVRQGEGGPVFGWSGGLRGYFVREV